MADPLKLLRDFCLENREIRELDELVIFGDIAFTKDSRTNYRVYGKESDFYTLGSLIYFKKHFLHERKEKAHAAYVREAGRNKVQPVTRADLKDLVDFFTNKNSKQPQSVDLTAPIAVPVPVQDRRAYEEDEASTNAKRPKHDDSEQRLRDKERIERLLDASLRNSAPKSDALRGLSDDLTAEKLASIRSKYVTKKRGQIQNTEDELANAAPHGAETGSIAECHLLGDAGSEATTPFIVGSMDMSFKRKERIWTTRTTKLESLAKNFQKSIFPILQGLKAREEVSARQLAQSQETGISLPDGGRVTNSGPVPNDSQVVGASRKGQVQQAGYSRYDQEKWAKKEQQTEGFQIDTTGTFHGVTLKSITEGAKPHSAGQENRKSPGSAPADPNSSLSRTNSLGTPRRRTSRTPILVIPAGANSLVTMYNAKDLLQDLRFVSTEQKKAENAVRENEVLIQRRKAEDGGTVPYRVVDTPSKLTAEEWDRVCAVFVAGPAWQFKGWPHNGNPVEIFSRIAAFHLKFDDAKADANVAKWNVQIIQLSKTKRHLDRAEMSKFWLALDKYMSKHKHYLRY